MEQKAQGLQKSWSDGLLRLRTACSQRPPKRINQQTPAPAAQPSGAATLPSKIRDVDFTAIGARAFNDVIE